MKAINLFVDFEFTSLSPDAQPISVGIVSEGTFKNQNSEEFKKYVEILNSALFNPDFKVDPLEAKKIEEKIFESSKSFYAEFSDFDINRCHDWVKENVVGKLIYNEAKNTFDKFQYDAVTGNVSMKDSTSEIKGCLKAWLEQFSDYQITFVVDCGTWDFYHLLQLIGEWEEKEFEVRDGDEIYDITSEKGILISSMGDYELIVTTKTGLPKLPSNISPVPFELNQFIAEKKGISVREAFELDREELACDAENSMMKEKKIKEYRYFSGKEWSEDNQKHNALFDARVMKAIYEKLSV